MSAVPSRRLGTEALLSAVAGIAVTLIATIATLQTDISRELFVGILFFLFASTVALAVYVAFWIQYSEVKAERLRLDGLRELEAYIPRLIRFRRRKDEFQIASNGEGTLRIECEVETPLGFSVPHVSLPVMSAVAGSDPPWTGVIPVRVAVDDADYNAAEVFVKRDRRFVADQSYVGRVIENWIVRIPVALNSEKRRCTFIVEARFRDAFRNVLNCEMCYTDICYVTDSIVVSIKPLDTMVIRCAPSANFHVEALQMEHDIVDLQESSEQSVSCSNVDRSRGVFWRSETAKLGYRYRLVIQGYVP